MTPARKRTYERRNQGLLHFGATVEVTKMTGWDKISDPLHIEGYCEYFGLCGLRRPPRPVPSRSFGRASQRSFQPEKRVNSIYFH